MPDAHFEHPRLVALYDLLEGERPDLDLYVAAVEEFGARSVLDVGCGTGVLALRLAGPGGVDVVGLDPAAGSLAVAREKPHAERVRWWHGDVASLPPLPVDLATMTGNVAQAVHDPAAWRTTLAGVHTALRPGGRLVAETRDPSRRAWEGWMRAATARTADLPGVGRVETWADLVDVRGPMVSFRTTFVFHADGAVLTSDSTLRFREREEMAADLEAAGLTVDDVRDAPDRPGLEFVFVARRRG